MKPRGSYLGISPFRIAGVHSNAMKAQCVIVGHFGVLEDAGGEQVRVRV